MRKTLIEGVLNYLIESPLRVLNFLIVSTGLPNIVVNLSNARTGAG